MPYGNQPAEALGWDSNLQASDGEGFSLLPAGTYDYTIVSVERGEFRGSEKMAASPKAIITIECSSAAASGRLRTNIILNKMLAWKITQLAKSCGVIAPDAPEGTSFQMPWLQLEGRRGKCRVSQREYSANGEKRTANDVAEWLPAAQTPAPVPAYTPQQQYHDPVPGSGF